jgi:acyl carrier protein
MTIEKSAVYQQLCTLLAEEFEIDPASIQPQSNLFDDLDIDSIDAIDMLTRLRTLTGKDLAADELKSVRTISDVVTLVEAS